MIDFAQFILGSVIVVLTVLMTVIGVQVFFILREFRRTIQKANKILASVKHDNLITENVEKVKKIIKAVQKRRFFKGKKPL